MLDGQRELTGSSERLFLRGRVGRLVLRATAVSPKSIRFD